MKDTGKAMAHTSNNVEYLLESNPNLSFTTSKISMISCLSFTCNPHLHTEGVFKTLKCLRFDVGKLAVLDKNCN
jgi:hypothetical protein